MSAFLRFIPTVYVPMSVICCSLPLALLDWYVLRSLFKASLNSASPTYGQQVRIS